MLALWDFSAHVLTGLSRPSSLKSSCKPKDTEASVAGMVFFKEKDSKVFTELISYSRYQTSHGIVKNKMFLR